MKTQLKRAMLLTAVASVAVVGCKKNTQETTNDQVATAQKELATATPGINLDYMDTSISPKEDFFLYVNGQWLKNSTIPDDKTRWGSFDELRKNTDLDALSILKEAVNDPNLDKTSDQGKAVLLYQSIMDLEARDAQGINPIKPYLAKIDAIKSITDLQAYLEEVDAVGGNGFFGFGVSADAKDSNKNVVYLRGGSLGLPDRDYYIKDDEDSKKKRDKYVAHVTRMLQFLGDNEADAANTAKQILAFETKMAKPKMDKVDRRDIRKTYNPTDVTDLKQMVPTIDWNHYLNATGFNGKGVDNVIIGDLKYTKALQDIFSEGNVSDWKAYLRWSMLRRAAGRLSQEIEKANWEFFSKELRGAKKQRALDERALSVLNYSLGEALGKLYVEKKFPAEAKAKAEKMIANVLTAFEYRIQALPWMSEATKAQAIEKLKATTVKVGYPDKWKDYSTLTVADGSSYFDNMIAVAKWNNQKNIDELGKPVDKTEWYMAPQVVNAYFNPAYNEIVFPAAILQPPFFSFEADDAVNYGGIGAVIGHEISHSFDDSGARFDKDGNMNNWWTEDDAKQFEALGNALADQYSAIEVLPETKINGKFTLGENIGDLGGVNVAYDALQLNMKENGRPEAIDGFSAEQRFFLSWATIWRTKYRNEALKNQIITDPHSPGMTRATQPLKNVDAFYEAFDIKEGDKMYITPEERVKIW